MRDKLSHELRNATVQASDKLDLWLKERLYDLRVFSSSYIISENLTGMEGGHRSRIETLAAQDHIKAYLKSVGDKFSVYEQLILINLAGKPVITNSDISTQAPLPEPWLKQLQMNPHAKSKTHFELYVGRQFMFIAEAVRASDGSPLGVLAAKINLSAIRSILKHQINNDIDEIYILNADGRLLVSSTPPTPQPLKIPIDTAQGASTSPNQSVASIEYISYRNKAVVGMTAPIPSTGWVMVAEMEKKKAYAEIAKLRRVTLLVVSGLMLSIGMLAYVFGHRLVRPVRRLSNEVTGVASGNLDVDIPVTGLSEVSYLTQVFNHMVASLRHNRDELSTANNALRKTNEELHQISITDGLTGLINRKHIMELFAREVGRSMRYNHELAVLMLDIDYFKKINDTYGHQVGDTVLRQLAESLRGSVRDSDHLGRYGGEEFLAILPDSGVHSAVVTAERIRRNIGRLQLTNGQDTFSVTVSIGVAAVPTDGQDVESILGEADNALYQAKAAGRNRVATSGNQEHQQTAKVHVLPNRKTR